MRLAFSTAICPTWELAAATAKAAALGYDGVEVFLPHAGRPGGDPAAGTPLAERDLVRLACERAGVAVAGVAAALYFADDHARDAATADAVGRAIDLAARVRAGQVRVLDAAVPPGIDRWAALLRYVDWLLPLADHAAAAGVTLLLQNALTYRTARRLWRVIEQASHPALAVAWDPLAAAVASESYAVSVPTLNSRIRHVLLRDARLAAGGDGQVRSSRGRTAIAAAVPSDAAARRVVALARLGEGDLHVRPFLDRLRGVGFDGWASVSYPPPGSGRTGGAASSSGSASPSGAALPPSAASSSGTAHPPSPGTPGEGRGGGHAGGVVVLGELSAPWDGPPPQPSPGMPGEGGEHVAARREDDLGEASAMVPDAPTTAESLLKHAAEQVRAWLSPPRRASATRALTKGPLSGSVAKPASSANHTAATALGADLPKA